MQTPREINKKEEKKLVQIYLFSMDGCPWCELFEPTWQKMINNEKKKIHIDFIKYKSKDLDNIDPKIRSINGIDVSNIGYPTIKICFADKEIMFEGERTARNIYDSVINLVENNRPDKKIIDRRLPLVENPDKAISDKLSSINSDLRLLSIDQQGGDKPEHDQQKVMVVKKLLKDTDFAMLKNKKN